METDSARRCPTPPASAGRWRAVRRFALLAGLFLLVLIATRASHLTGPIDDPHSWRQCETAQYAHAFHREGIDLLRPSVCWMGSHKTVLLEFPFPEMLMAGAYAAFGEDLCVARLVTLAFFAGSALYLYGILRLLAHERLAVLATGVYLVLPLSIFYSRAIHVDFAAVCFAHAMAFHLLRAMRRPGTVDVALAIAAGCLAFLIKAPYAFYLALPLFFLAARTGSRRAMALVAGSFLAAGIGFLVWRWHVELTNAAAPDWSFLPGYSQHVDMGNWYYGPWSLRFDAAVWQGLANRFHEEVATRDGTWLCGLGVVVSGIAATRGHRRQVLPLWLWAVAVLGYVVIFLNLNRVHDYYQIPLLAVCAVFIALAIDAPVRLCRPHWRVPAVALSLLVLLRLALGCVDYANDHYFAQDVLREEAGEIIRAGTPADSVIIAAADLPGTAWCDPRLLFRARRIGWSLHAHELTGERIERLRSQGATHLAILTRSVAPGSPIPGLRLRSHALRHGAGTVQLAELDRRIAVRDR